MKTTIFLILLLVVAGWLGAFLGHCADRHIRPITPTQIEEVQP